MAEKKEIKKENIKKMSSLTRHIGALKDYERGNSEIADGALKMPVLSPVVIELNAT